MPYDQELATRMRSLLVELGGEPFAEKKMFGGVGFLVRGNMACGVHKAWVVSRVGAARYDDALSMPGARPFDITGRPMAGWVMVDAAACREDEDLRFWVSHGLAFAQSLPPK